MAKIDVPKAKAKMKKTAKKRVVVKKPIQVPVHTIIDEDSLINGVVNNLSYEEMATLALKFGEGGDTEYEFILLGKINELFQNLWRGYDREDKKMENFLDLLDKAVKAGKKA